MGRACWDPYSGFPVFSSSQERVQGVNTLPLAVKFEQAVCNVSVQGSPLETTLHSYSALEHLLPSYSTLYNFSTVSNPY